MPAVFQIVSRSSGKALTQTDTFRYSGSWSDVGVDARTPPRIA